MKSPRLSPRRRRLSALALGLAVGVPLVGGLQFGSGPARALADSPVPTTLPTLPLTTTTAAPTTTTAPTTTSTTSAADTTTPTTAATVTTDTTPTTVAAASSLPALPTVSPDPSGGTGATVGSSSAPSSGASSSSTGGQSPSTTPVVAATSPHHSPWGRVFGLAALLIALVLYSEGFGILGGRIKSLSSRAPRRTVPPRN